MFPRCPDYDDPGWCEVAVRSRTQSQTEIKRMPLDVNDADITTVFVGDTIAIMPEVKHQYYVAARVGYHVGWINFKHVKLVSLKPRNRHLEETRPGTSPTRDERIAQYQEQLRQRQERQQAQEINYYHQQDTYDEQETQPAPATIPQYEPPIPRKDVNRIIDKLKSLGGLFGRR